MVIVNFLDFTRFFNDNPLHNAIEQCKLNDRNQKEGRKSMTQRKKGSNQKNGVLPEKVKAQFQVLENELNIHFTNKALIYQAFTHSSYVNEHRRKQFTDNERLEFLGDAV